MSNLTTLSYDIRQTINAKSIGVLKYNNQIRKDLLNRNIGLYPQYHLNEGIGYISNPYSNEFRKSSLLNGDSLLDYTHVLDSAYQNYINKHYSHGDSISYYQHGSLPTITTNRWNGQYDDYTEYIDEVTGVPANLTINFLANLFNNFKIKNSAGTFGDEKEILQTASILNDILQYDNIKYAMEKTRIGTINPNPVAAYSGAITTNINNFSGTDTALGKITNFLYARTLNSAAHFNSLRKTHYITPSAYHNIGNKLHTVSLLNTDFRIDDETGRIVADFTEQSANYEYLSLSDYGNESNFIDYSRDIADNNNARYRNLIYFTTITGKQRYLPFSEKHYGPEIPKQVKTVYLNGKSGSKIFKIWNEGEKGFIDTNFSNFNGNDSYYTIDIDEGHDGLLQKTQKLFRDGVIDTMVGRFHTSGKNDITHNISNLTQTAISDFGMSHGRNLLTKNAYKGGETDRINSYNNPYCRTWTYHHQYDKVSKLIRPFIEEYDGDNGLVTNVLNVENLQKPWIYGRDAKGANRLNDNTVLNKTGFINISPSSNSKVDIKKCMFSIENLAWKDSDINLSSEQTGPNNGRIMWFPPYDLKFNENVSVNWSQNEFIGRGEKIYTYTNTERTGTLSFILLVDHPSILDMWKKYGKENDEHDNEQTLLRFFAGCDVLTLDEKQTNVNNIDEESDTTQPAIKTVVNNSEKMIFYVYFPYCYSGFTDTLNEAIKYLSTDYETSKQGETCKTDNDILSSMSGNYKAGETSKLNEDGLEDREGISFQKFIEKDKEDLEHMKINKVKIDAFQTNIEVNDIKNTDKKRNDRDSLCERRLIFGKKLVKKYLDIDNDIIEAGSVSTQMGGKNQYNHDDKINRCIRVEIDYEYKQTKKEEREARKEERKTARNDRKETRRAEREKRRNERACNRKNPRRDDCETNMDSSNKLNTGIGVNDTMGDSTNIITRSSKFINGYKYEDVSVEKYQRWDEEAQYFEMLKENDYILYERIVDKIKYFTPAFHSVTPEGFNARLSFLHQCTRQGKTFGVSDVNNKYKSAGNIAFGRPPICVLRIGDFFNTKIVIDSVTIDYENPQWDMNTEGIGMQPMFARISLNFKFLGGNDIAGPIARLQNAVSFNYYANQSIYDDRAYKSEDISNR